MSNLEQLLDNYQGKEKFLLENNEVKFGLEDVSLISGLTVATDSNHQCAKDIDID